MQFHTNTAVVLEMLAIVVIISVFYGLSKKIILFCNKVEHVRVKPAEDPTQVLAVIWLHFHFRKCLLPVSCSFPIEVYTIYMEADAYQIVDYQYLLHCMQYKLDSVHLLSYQSSLLS